MVKLEIDVDSSDPQRVRPGLRFLGTVEVERVAKDRVVPVEALFNRGSGPVVNRKAGWGNEEVRPTLGRRNDRQVEIRSGLKLGDRVSRRELAESR